MGTFGKFDPDESVREGWARDSEDEVSYDGYNAFIQITSTDGTTGFSVTNTVGGTAFRAKSDGDGYVSRNLGVGVLNPTVKLDVDGTAQVQGFRMPTGAVSGYVLTSDSSGNATWEDAYEIGRASCRERVQNITVWTDVGKTTKIREEQISYNSENRVSQMVTIQYDLAGIEAERMTESFTYSGGQVANISRTVTLSQE